MPPTKQATIRCYTARSSRKQQLQRARESRKRNREPEIEPPESDESRCELGLTVSSIPSSISSPVASSSISAAACAEHVIGASGKKFKAFHKKGESGSFELIDHPTNSDVQEPVDNTPLPTNIFKPFCSLCLPCLWTNSCASTVRGVSEKGNGCAFEGNMFKLRHFDRY